MDNEILESIKHIKNISKKKVTADKIFTNIKKKDSSISFDELLEILDTMVKDGILHVNGMDKLKTYMIPENADSVFASSTSDENPEIILEETNLEEKSRQEDISSTQSDKILNEIKNFKSFRLMFKINSPYWKTLLSVVNTPSRKIQVTITHRTLQSIF